MNDHSRVADGAAVTSWFALFASWLIDATPLLQAIALVVSILAGLAAIYYHLSKARQR